MGSILYDFLSESLLFDEARIAHRFTGLSDSELRNELALYREYCVNNVAELRREIPADRPNSLLQTLRGLQTSGEDESGVLSVEGKALT
jgi:hypothetical protein